MSHSVGTLQNTPLFNLGPDFGPPTTPPDTWALDFAPPEAPSGTRFILLHFTGASFPASNRLEVDLGYDTDVFTSADGTDFWTRPANVNVLAGRKVPVRYITNGAAAGGVKLAEFGRGERQPGIQDPTALSNCDPFLKDPSYTEPKYDPFWFCNKAAGPNWENSSCVTPAGDIRNTVAQSVGMI